MQELSQAGLPPVRHPQRQVHPRVSLWIHDEFQQVSLGASVGREGVGEGKGKGRGGEGRGGLAWTGNDVNDG